MNVNREISQETLPCTPDQESPVEMIYKEFLEKFKIQK